MLRWLKNYIGSFKGFGGCPNCGDSWGWKPSGFITYLPDEGLPSISFGVMICEECLEHPEALNVEQILKDLRGHGWNQPSLELVESALANHAA